MSNYILPEEYKPSKELMEIYKEKVKEFDERNK